MNFLCICTYFKGVEFLKSCKAEGNNVYLLTNQKLKDKAWPRESIEEIFYLKNIENTFDTYQIVLVGLAAIMRNKKIDRVVALDDFDVEKAALVREHFRIPGMGQTTARYFRDKLAMRMQAQDAGITVPPFCSLFNDIDITEYLQRSSPPWVIKPRSEASAAGIKKVHSFQEAWDNLHSLGDERHNFLIEQFKPGDVYHVDSLTINGKVIFTRCSQYLNTPFEVSHGGGIFRSVTLEHNSEDDAALKKMNEDVMRSFGMKSSASHTETIKCYEDGKFYFLETASRVGGANLAEMVEFSSGINLWREWAKIETIVAVGGTYELPMVEDFYSGIVISLSSHENPDYTPFNDPEIVWKMDEEYHIGLIVRSKDRAKVLELMEKYASMIRDLGYHASAPAPDKPVH
jgi:hypothetical protein